MPPPPLPLPRPHLRALLIDLSGTLHIGSTALPGAVRALQRLDEAGVPYRLCSNASKESSGAVRGRLEGMGIKVGEGEVGEGGEGKEEKEKMLWTSLGAAREVVRERGYKRPYFLLSSSAMAEFPEFDPASCGVYDPSADYDSVIFGLAPDLMTYSHLNNAFQILSRSHGHGTTGNSSASTSSTSSSSTPTPTPTAAPKPKPAFLTTHKAAYLRDPSNQLVLGPGPFVEALEYALRPSGVKAEVVGKPMRGFYEKVVGSLGMGLGLEMEGREGCGANGVDGSEGRRLYPDVAMIGDDVSTDLSEGAVELGFWRVLVKTGKYRPGDETREGLLPPDEAHESFASFVEAFLKDRS